MSLQNFDKDKGKNKKIEQIKALTTLAMEGKMSFSDSLSKRLKLINANKEHIKKLIFRLKKNISKSILNNKNFFKTFSDNIIILSGGFKEYIQPIAEKYYIKRKCLCKYVCFRLKGYIKGFDKGSPLAREDGKSKQLKTDLMAN
jgi:D-3-phosphoglycerate dehydrogenase